MLKYRLLTATLLLPILFAIIFLLPLSWFAIFIAVIVCIMMSEWLVLAGVNSRFWIIIGSLFTFMISLLSVYLPPIPLFSISLLLWLFLTGILVHYLLNQTVFSWLKKLEIQIILGLSLLVCYTKAVIILLQLTPRPWWLLFGLIVIWGADAGAYAFGRFYGKNSKFLAPAISPKKTWIGLWGGLITGLIISILFCLFIPMSGAQRAGLIIASPLIILFSIIGDLFESLMKRKAGVKDSGTWLPGHGGFLDRLDSTMAALPLLAFVLLLLKIC